MKRTRPNRPNVPALDRASRAQRAARPRSPALLLALGLTLARGATVAATPAPLERAHDVDTPPRRPIEELFLTEVVYPQEAHEVQLTLAAQGERSDDGRAGLLQAGLEYGVTDRWELSLDWNVLVHRRPRHSSRTTGPGDLEIGTKHLIYAAPDDSTLVALGFELGLPAGDPDRGLGEGTIEYAPKFLLGRSWPAAHGLTLLTEVGPEFVQRVRGDSEDEGQAHALALGAGLVYPWRRFALSLEGRWTNNRWNHHGEENRVEMGPGLHWRPTASWQIAAGCQFGRDRHEDLLGVQFLILREF